MTISDEQIPQEEERPPAHNILLINYRFNAASYLWPDSHTLHAVLSFLHFDLKRMLASERCVSQSQWPQGSGLISQHKPAEEKVNAA